MKTSREIMEILEAYDLTGSYRAAAELVGCDHHTVARYVRLRESGQSPVAREHRVRPIDEYLEKIEELVVRSGGKVRADVVHRRITAMGFGGGERTTRRAVAEVKQRFASGQRRVARPWITEPGLWLQWDWGEGPRIGGRRTSLWCAWLAWSRFRMVIPLRDKTLPTIVSAWTRHCGCTISVEGVRYSVPHHLVDTRVWARFHGDELIVTAVGDHGPAEVARHPRSTPASPVISDEHYPPHEDKSGDRAPKATFAEEAAFLALGPGAASWLVEAAEAGTRRIRRKMAEPVALAKLHPAAEVDQALGTAAIAGRFAENDLIRILAHQAGREHAAPRRAGEAHSLQPGTSAWSNFGLTSNGGES